VGTIENHYYYYYYYYFFFLRETSYDAVRGEWVRMRVTIAVATGRFSLAPPPHHNRPHYLSRLSDSQPLSTNSAVTMAIPLTLTALFVCVLRAVLTTQGDK
jgi:hypothetical protein